MLDKDVITIDKPLPCGCEFQHKIYFKSGWEYDNAKDFLKNRYGLDITNQFTMLLSIKDDSPLFENLKSKLEVSKICNEHKIFLLREISSGVENYFNKIS